MRRLTAVLLQGFLFICIAPLSAQQTKGIPWTGAPPVTESVRSIMERQAKIPFSSLCKMAEPELEEPDRSALPESPNAPAVAQWPPVSGDQRTLSTNSFAQTIGISFTGAVLSETGSFPADNMGTVGPSQFIVFVNGRMRTFDKSTGVADGVLNVHPDVFFSSVLTPPAANNFTSDPRARYDRLTKRWFLLIIDVPGQTGAIPNRILIAVSDAASNGIISGSTVWSFYYIDAAALAPALANTFFDYPTLGIDVNALYIGTNDFTTAGSFKQTDGFVVRKSSLLSGGPIVATVFRGLASGSGAGPYTPQGVDNYDPAATEGYFVGTDNATFNTLQLRRVSNPGGMPTISANISLTVPTTRSPIKVPHLGNSSTPAANGYLDGLDDRLFAAHCRNGHLWTAHNIQANSSGVGSSSGGRNAVRWYDINNLSTTPTLVQSGTVFDNAASNPVYYMQPSVMVSGQNHMVAGFSSAGAADRINAATAGRLSSDAIGTTQNVTTITASSTDYNPPGDAGGSGGRRWGDYTYTSLDPNDDMTMWTITSFCNATNTYGVRVSKLLSPPPAAPSSVSPTGIGKLSSVNVIVTGTSSSGSGFFDPGAGFLNRITATVNGGAIVNSISYTDPTHVTLNLNTLGATQGLHTITITNPDGQSLTSAAILTVNVALPVHLLDLTGQLNNNMSVSLNWATLTETNNMGFDVERSETGDPYSWKKIGFLAGAGTTTTKKAYSFNDASIQPDRIYLYRLKQIDIDGRITYSNQVTIKVHALLKGLLTLIVFPNPVVNASSITYHLPSNGRVELALYDGVGRKIAELVNKDQQAGSYHLDFSKSSYGLSNGIYFYKLRLGDESVTTKVVIVK